MSEVDTVFLFTKLEVLHLPSSGNAVFLLFHPFVSMLLHAPVHFLFSREDLIHVDHGAITDLSGDVPVEHRLLLNSERGVQSFKEISLVSPWHSRGG